jgi:two-component system, NtrC family, response regulator HydG
VSDFPERTRRAAFSLPNKTRSASFTLRVQGASAPNARTITAERDTEFVVGSLEACDLHLVDPLVSRRHAVFDVVDTGLRVRDAGSTNGTFINDVLVSEATLRGGERVRVGGATLDVRRGEDAMVTLADGESFGRLLGASVAMRRLFPRLQRLADATVPVVLHGETGTGKEILAEALHEQGPRANAPFIVFDCTSTAPNLVESELFGHERGAFTGATETRRGVFELAHGGTLLIDEIGDLELPLQAKLLRVVERSEVRRVGGSKTLSVDVRILAATRRDLDAEVSAGRFRDDLYHRLCVARVTLPALRDRTGDIALLAQAFADSLGGGKLRAEWLARLETHTWPGNVRELRNVITRHVALGESALEQEQERRELPRREPIEEIAKRGLPFSMARQLALEAFEQAYVSNMLERCGDNVSQAARASGIGRRHFQRVRERLRTGREPE